MSSSHGKKFLRALLFCTILFLPTQLGRHFWPSFSLVDGIRIDYLSPTLYVTDILIVLLFIVWSLSCFSKLRIGNQESGIGRKRNSLIYNSLFIILFLSICIGIISSLSPTAGFYKFIKILEFVFFGFMVAKNINIKKDFIIVASLFTAGIIFESALAIWQFVNQSSIGGIFWFFGERTFSGQTVGIANANINGQLILRPYGTFPHPNVLAGYLVIVMTLIISNIKYQISNIKKWLLIFSLIAGTIALLLTLSRVAIVVWLLVMGSWFIATFRKKFIIYHLSFIIFLIVGSILLSPLPSRFASITTVDKESFVLRQQLNNSAIEMFKQSPILGVGLNNFLVNLPRYQKPQAGPLFLQPVHNIYLLILAETGIVGFVFLLWFISKTYKRITIHKRSFPFSNEKRNSLFIILSSVLFLGLFDHYFLTLQQGQLLLALVFGLCWTKEA